MGYRLDSPQSSDRDDFWNYCSRLWRRQNHRFKICVFIVSLVLIVILCKDIDLSFYTTTKLDVTEFSYPMKIRDFPRVVDLYRNGLLNDSVIKPINLRYANVDFIVNPQVESHVGLLVIVKSARKNYRKRNIIRNTWGESKYLKENALSPDLPTKVLFICGKSDSEDLHEDLQYDFKLENQYEDIIIAGFNDSYYNNTYKSMVAFRWALTEFGGDFKYLALFDDDIYADMVNIGAFLRELQYKRVIKIASPYSGFPYLRFTPRRDEMSVAIPQLQHGLYMGVVFTESPPERNPKSKWYVSYEDYGYNMYVPYIPGAGIILDPRGVSDLYYGAHFLEHLWIDDVYLGIIAAKMGLVPLHSPNFHSLLGLQRQLTPHQISETLIMHGFECTAQIADWWRKREFANLMKC